MERVALARRAVNDNTSDEEFRSGDYEVFGFGGVGIVVRTLTDNPNRAVGQIKAAARKHEVKMASAGSVLFLFDLKGIIHLQPAATPPPATTATTLAASSALGLVEVVS